MSVAVAQHRDKDNNYTGLKLCTKCSADIVEFALLAEVVHESIDGRLLRLVNG